MQNTQKVLQQDQIEAFYHDQFVEDQARDFANLLQTEITTYPDLSVIDVGGGCGFFAKAIQSQLSVNVQVMDTDIQSIEFCKQAGIRATLGDALNPDISGANHIACFNLILHHLVGASDDETCKLQKRALAAWQNHARAIFVNEYIYESFGFNNASGWLIYRITSSPTLSKLGRIVAKFIPSLKANTFGIGVRFRSHDDWVKIFDSLGYNIKQSVIGREEHVSLPRRMLLIKSCRRDSFLLEPKKY